MIHVEGQTFGPGAIVLMDDKYFTRCRFDGCTLTYAGGDFGWMDCEFGQVQINFAASAERAMNFARIFGLLAAPSAQAQQPPPAIPGSSKGEH